MSDAWEQQAVREDRDRLRAEVDRLTRERDEARADYERAKKNGAVLGVALTKATEERDEARRLLTDEQQEVELKRSALAAVEQDRDSLRAEVASLTRGLAAAKTRSSERAEEVEKLRAQLDAANLALAGAAERTRDALGQQAMAEADRLRARLAAVEGSLDNCRGDCPCCDDIHAALAPAPAEPKPCDGCDPEYFACPKAGTTECPTVKPSSPLAAPEAAEARDHLALTGGKP